MLSNQEISRYSRQLLVPEIGVHGQSRILSTSVLVVGAGGLGSSMLLYLASAGIGKIGIVEYDTVELSNLQRQIIHSEKTVHTSKCQSAQEALLKLNSTIQVETFDLLLSSENALEIIQQYDIIADATDNVATRYLLNDACVLSGKPLVSASAIRMEGQLTVYHYQNGPCYRCLFPVPPPPETVTNCSDGGVLGVVPGLLGSIQALEILKIASGIGPSYSEKLLLVDALTGAFRTVRLRPRKKDCVICGDSPTITKLMDYVAFCGSSPTDKSTSLQILQDKDRISCHEFQELKKYPESWILIDVREPVQFDICSLAGSTSTLFISKPRPLMLHLDIPWTVLESNPNHPKIVEAHTQGKRIFVICRRGNDSQLAVSKLLQVGIPCQDIQGGLEAWTDSIDPEFPKY